MKKNLPYPQFQKIKNSFQKQTSHDQQINQEHDVSHNKISNKQSNSGKYKETKTSNTSYVFITPNKPLQYIDKRCQKTIAPYTHSENSKYTLVPQRPNQMTTRSINTASFIPDLQIMYSSQLHTKAIATQNVLIAN